MLRRSLPPAAAAEKEAAMYFIGIDLGTSACKLLLVDEAGAIVNEVAHEYPLIFPHPGWSEQKPSVRRNAGRTERTNSTPVFPTTSPIANTLIITMPACP